MMLFLMKVYQCVGIYVTPIFRSDVYTSGCDIYTLCYTKVKNWR